MNCSYRNDKPVICLAAKTAVGAVLSNSLTPVEWFTLLNNTHWYFVSQIVPTSAAMATPSSDSSVSNGLYVPTGLANGDVKPVISSTPLADFLMQLEDYTPTVSSHELNTSKYGFILSDIFTYLFACPLDPRRSYRILSQSSRIWSVRSKDVSSAWLQMMNC